MRTTSFYARYVVPHLIELAMRQKTLLPFRQRVIGGAEAHCLLTQAGQTPGDTDLVLMEG